MFFLRYTGIDLGVSPTRFRNLVCEKRKAPSIQGNTPANLHLLA